jgi:uncharacterized protein (DUF58 family)
MNLKQRIKAAVRRRFYLWLDKRQSASARVQLQQDVLFVFPTAYGAWFVLLVALMYLFGTNYQNNLILLCAYALLSLFCFCILAAFFNLHRLTFCCGSEPFGYAGSPLSLVLSIEQVGARKMITLSSEEFSSVTFQVLPTQIHLQLHCRPRGYYQLQRFTISSCYPFGLIRCWTHIQLKQAFWFYPQPTVRQQSLVSSAAEADQFDQIRPYQSSDPLSAIDWKRMAKDPWQPVIRHHSQSAAAQPEDQMVITATGAALEQQLSEFCGRLLALEQQGRSYSLKTPEQQLGPDQGYAHLHRCLKALSLC